MPDPDNTDKLKELTERVSKRELTRAQRVQLDALIKLAWTIVAPEEALEGEFDASFESNDDRLIVEYQSASAGSFSVKGSVKG
jgi:hypothetical protein